MLTLAGICGDYPPTDPPRFDEFVAGLPSADIAAAIADAEPLDDPVPFRFPASVRHRYERLAAFPAGLLVIGDAVCSFNPVYGQGMTVAAAQAMTLRGLLARQAVPDARRYFRAITAAIDVAWDIAASADLAFPQVPGKRPAKVRLVNAYMPRLHAAAAHDHTLAAALVRVIGLKDRPEGLLRPDRILRVPRGQPGQQQAPHPHPGRPGAGRHASPAPGATSAVTGSRLPSPIARLPCSEWTCRPGAMPSAELDRVRAEYDTVRLHASIGCGTPDDEHQGQGEVVRQARCDGLAAAREHCIAHCRSTTQEENQ